MRSAAWARSRRRWRSAAAARGVEIRVDAPVREVIVEKGRAVGVVTEKRRGVRAPRGRLEPQSETAVPHARRPRASLPADFVERIENWRCGSGTFRMNVALSELPDFTCLPGQRPRRASHRGHHHRAEPRLHGAGLFRRAHARLVEAADRRDADPVDARRQPGAARAACREPVLPARRAASCRTALVGRSSRDGRRPDDRHGRSLCAELQARRFSAGRSCRRSISSARSGSSAATSFTARSTLDQMFSARPMLGHADYRAPIPGPLHVRLRHASRRRRHRAPGHNAAREVLRDLRRR